MLPSFLFCCHPEFHVEWGSDHQCNCHAGVHHASGVASAVTQASRSEAACQHPTANWAACAGRPLPLSARRYTSAIMHLLLLPSCIRSSCHHAPLAPPLVGAHATVICCDGCTPYSSAVMHLLLLHHAPVPTTLVGPHAMVICCDGCALHSSAIDHLLLPPSCACC